MNKSIILLGAVIAICLTLIGCGSGLGDEEVAASVEAQLAEAQQQTVEAMPTATSSPISNEEEKAYSVTEGEDGWQTYLYNEDGFSISLPPQWVPDDLGAEYSDEMASLFIDENPEFENPFASEYIGNLAAMGIKLMAFDTSPESLGSGIATNVNVLVLDMPMDITFDDYVELNLIQLKNQFGENLAFAQERQLLGKVVAEKIEYQVEMNDVFGQAHNVTYQQYLMLDGRTQYVMTFTSTEDQFSQNEDLFSEIAQSFELVE